MGTKVHVYVYWQVFKEASISLFMKHGVSVVGMRSKDNTFNSWSLDLKILFVIPSLSTVFKLVGCVSVDSHKDQIRGRTNS